MTIQYSRKIDEKVAVRCAPPRSDAWTLTNHTALLQRLSSIWISVHLLVLFVIFFLAFVSESPGQSQTQPGSVLWTFSLPGNITSMPAFSPDGATMYLSTTMGFYAITNAGSNKWTFPVSQSIVCSPVVAEDGTIYTGDNSANVVALNPDGTQKWKVSVQEQSRYYATTPALGTNGDLYVPASGRLFAIKADGSKRWTFDYDDYNVRVVSPIVALDGTIYVAGGLRRQLYAITPEGSQKWALDVESLPGESCAISANGRLYLGTQSLLAISAAGSVIWSNSASGYVGCSPILNESGNILIADNSFHLECFNPDGLNLWSAAGGVTSYGYPYTSPAVDSTGSIYFSASNCVFSISSDGTMQWVFVSPYSLQPTPPPRPPTAISPEVGPDGTVYAVFGSQSFGSTLYAIKGSGAGPSTSAWPMLHQNLRHTGKVEKPSIGNLKKRADANFDIQMAGEIGHSYTLQSTSNFLNWNSITNFIARTVPMTVTDPSASNAFARYYRVTSP